MEGRLRLMPSFRLSFPPLVTPISQFSPPDFVFSRESPVISAFAPPPHVHTQLCPHTHQLTSLRVLPRSNQPKPCPDLHPQLFPWRIPLDCCCTRASPAHDSIPRPFPPPAFSVKFVLSPKVLLSDWFLNSTVHGNLGLLVGKHVSFLSLTPKDCNTLGLGSAQESTLSQTVLCF